MSISLLITVVLLYTGWIVLCKLEEEESRKIKSKE